MCESIRKSKILNALIWAEKRGSPCSDSEHKRSWTPTLKFSHNLFEKKNAAFFSLLLMRMRKKLHNSSIHPIVNIYIFSSIQANKFQ